jgi:hypothetical protein
MSLMTLANDIAQLMRRRKASSNEIIKTGVISGSSVLVDGKYYTYDAAVDIDMEDGTQVYVIISEDRSVAVVIGK